MKKIIKVLFTILLSVSTVFASPVVKDGTPIDINFGLNYIGDTYMLKDIEISSQSNSATVIEVKWNTGMTLAEENKKAEWVEEGITPTSVTYRMNKKNTINDIRTYLSSLRFNGTYDKNNSVTVHLYATYMQRAYVDKQGNEHYYKRVRFTGDYGKFYEYLQTLNYLNMKAYPATLTSAEEEALAVPFMEGTDAVFGPLDIRQANGEKFVNPKSIDVHNGIINPGKDEGYWYYIAGPEAGTVVYSYGNDSGSSGLRVSNSPFQHWLGYNGNDYCRNTIRRYCGNPDGSGDFIFLNKLNERVDKTYSYGDWDDGQNFVGAKGSRDYLIEFSSDFTTNIDIVENGKGMFTANSPDIKQITLTSNLGEILNEKITYGTKVVILDKNNSELANFTVTGEDVTRNISFNEVQGSTFKSFKRDINGNTLTITPLYEDSNFTINYQLRTGDEGNISLSTVNKNYGSNLTDTDIPTITTPEGWFVDGFYINGKSISKNELKTLKITDNLNIEIRTYKDTIGKDDTLIGTSTPDGIDDRQQAIVTLKDGDTVLENAVILKGKMTVFTNTPKKEGFVFNSWDKSLSDITEDTTVNVIWDVDKIGNGNGTIEAPDGIADINQAIITFVDYDNKELHKEVVIKGQGTTYSKEPLRMGYKFKGWSINPTEPIYDNVTAIAVYEGSLLKVKFLGCDGRLIGEENVEYGKDATKYSASIYGEGMKNILSDKELKPVNCNTNKYTNKPANPTITKEVASNTTTSTTSNNSTTTRTSTIKQTTVSTTSSTKKYTVIFRNCKNEIIMNETVPANSSARNVPKDFKYNEQYKKVTKNLDLKPIDCNITNKTSTTNTSNTNTTSNSTTKTNTTTNSNTTQSLQGLDKTTSNNQSLNNEAPEGNKVEIVKTEKKTEKLQTALIVIGGVGAVLAVMLLAYLGIYIVYPYLKSLKLAESDDDEDDSDE